MAASHEFAHDRPIGRLAIYSKYPATIIKFVLNDRYGYRLSQPLAPVVRMAPEAFADLAKLSGRDLVTVCLRHLC